MFVLGQKSEWHWGWASPQSNSCFGINLLFKRRVAFGKCLACYLCEINGPCPLTHLHQFCRQISYIRVRVLTPSPNEILGWGFLDSAPELIAGDFWYFFDYWHHMHSWVMLQVKC